MRTILDSTETVEGFEHALSQAIFPPHLTELALSFSSFPAKEIQARFENTNLPSSLTELSLLESITITPSTIAALPSSLHTLSANVDPKRPISEYNMPLASLPQSLLHLHILNAAYTGLQVPLSKLPRRLQDLHLPQYCLQNNEDLALLPPSITQITLNVDNLSREGILKFAPPLSRDSLLTALYSTKSLFFETDGI